MSNNKIKNIIEKMQTDHEESRSRHFLKVDKTDNYYMIKNTMSNSIYSSKVVYSHINPEYSIDDILTLVKKFFDSKDFSWWLSMDEDKDIIAKLERYKWKVLDNYNGRYLDANFSFDSNLKYRVIEVNENNEKHIDDIVYVTGQIWGSDKMSDELAKESYRQYLSSDDRRGGYLLAYIDEIPVGYANYRMSQCGEFLYLCGTGVIEEFRKRGIYKELLQKRFDIAIQKKARYVVAQARVGYSDVILSKIGFKKCGEFVVYTNQQSVEI